LHSTSSDDEIITDETTEATSPTATTIEKTQTVSTIPRPDPAILVASKSEDVQQTVIGLIAISLLFGTYLSIQFLTGLESTILPFPSLWEFIDRFLIPLPLGLIFIALGASHFLIKGAYTSIVPPKGTWGGLWNVPSPGSEALGLSYEEYHAYWSGLAELGGGVLLIWASVTADGDFIPIPAGLLGLLVLCVTPSNVYMFTHDAVMGGDDEEMNIPKIPYPYGHLNRGIIQCILLAELWKLTFH